jgi:hypothetical protein
MKPDIMDELRAELMAVEPSPGFAAGVRMRIEGRRVPRQALWLAAAASVGVATWATVAMPVKPDVAISPAAFVSEVAAPVGPPATSAVPGTVKLRRAFTPSRTRDEPVTHLAASGPPFEVLVPPDQAIAVRRLLLMHGAGRRFALASDGHAVDEVTGTLLDLAPIEIPKITIELLPGPEPGVGGKIK